MAKKSQKHLLRQERGQAGCISGFINIFHFRHGRSTKRLLSDRSLANKQVVGGEYSGNQTVLLDPTEKCESIEFTEESNVLMLDAAKTSMKELMEEEMCNESGNPKDSATGSEHSNSNDGNHLKKRQKKRSRSRIKSSDLDVIELGTSEQLRPENGNQVQEQRSLDNLDLEMIMEELAQINQKNVNGSENDLHGGLDEPSGQTVNVVEEKLVAALILLAQQRLNSSKHFGDDGNNCYSKEFMDTLQTVSLNKGLLLKLLKDPDSKLVKHVQSLEDARLGRDTITNSLPASTLSEDKLGKLKCDESSSHKQRNFFRRRTKSQESDPVAGDRDFPNHKKTVILKTGQAGAQSPQIDTRVSSLRLQSPGMDDKFQNDKNTSQFSFTEIKRKLRHAIGKERHGVSPDRLNLKFSQKHQNSNTGDKGGTGENLCWSSPNRNHFYTERFLTTSPSLKKGEQVGQLKDLGTVAVSETSQYSRLRGSSIYVEAKKHLSEMLNNGSETPELVTRQVTKSLGRILSLPEYKNGTPCCSPRKYGDDIFMTTQIKLSPRGIVRSDLSGLLQENLSNQPIPRKQHLEGQPGISSSNCEAKIQSLATNDKITLIDDQEHFIEIQPVTEDILDPEARRSPGIVADTVEMAESKPREEEKTVTNFSESSNNLIGGDIDTEDDREVDNTQVPSQLSVDSSPSYKLSFSGEDQLLQSSESPPHGPVSTEIEDSDFVMEKLERPSPISVLEPLFTDDDISPASTTSQPVGKEIQPCHIHFEEQSSASDQGICTRISLEDEESAFEYVEAVLLGSGLNWDEFLLRWISMYEILDTELFDEVKLFSSRPQHDQKLLFECANEALKEVCAKYFGCFSGISHFKMNIQPAPRGMDLILEIWRLVEWHLLQLPQPHSLDKLVKADLAGSGKWMDIQLDFECIVSEMGETIFTELVEEAVLNFSDGALECEFAVLQTESNAIEATNL
ncbi:uncharacterized protein LOC125221761 [Salvia hispanica]|uniref:uncharacterized protein LOC125221761 n=1 Tax=Salvia hispanica TaxID=49212 RepID=UPI002009D465|nr:uncharacterized protein LOC125221761 [Salvia hispanica]XP_047979950.1 uncharacterized protein LOC125221761 [Salvia hispanica]XP_047979951.1 uncharacterized protein LOC125221761 [Salvia hispanica]